MKDPHRYARMRDEETQRTRWEMWLVIAIVVVVVIGGLIWRAVTGHRSTPQAGWSPNESAARGLPAAGSLPNQGAPPRP